MLMIAYGSSVVAAVGMPLSGQEQSKDHKVLWEGGLIKLNDLQKLYTTDVKKSDFALTSANLGHVFFMCPIGPFVSFASLPGLHQGHVLPRLKAFWHDEAGQGVAMWEL